MQVPDDPPVAGEVSGQVAGWYPDPLGRYPMRHWAGDGWTAYVWQDGQVVVDPAGTGPRPPFETRLRSALSRQRGALLATAVFLVLSAAITFLGPGGEGKAGQLATWIVLLPLLAANFAERVRWLRWLLWIGAGLTAAALLIASVAFPLTRGSPPDATSLVFLGGAIALLLTLIPNARASAARVVPIDPSRPTHTMALQLAILTLAVWLLSQVGGQSLDPKAYAQLTPLDTVRDELPLFAAGFFGVGLLVRRNLRESLQRLGLVRPTWTQVLVALALMEALFAVNLGMQHLSDWLTPDVSRRVNDVSNQIYGRLGQNILAFALLSLAAGIGEETLFRGALQPRLGLILTTVLFTAVHVQYGISFILLIVLIAGLGLGLLRIYACTTACIITHASYDFVDSLQVPETVFWPAFGLQVLAAICLAWVFRARLWPALRSLEAGRRASVRNRAVEASA
jgi:membrane protease YdiL (CAAX protease family)